MTVRVRYNGRKNKKVWRRKQDGGYWETIKGCPKNTLVTIRENDQIYFGISRVNQKHDVFSKEFGKTIAQGRAEKAKDDFSFSVPLNGMFLDETGLKGSCEVQDVKKLLEYFDNIDQYNFNRGKLFNSKERLQKLSGL